MQRTSRITILEDTSLITLGDGNTGTVALESIQIAQPLAGTLTITGFPDSAGVDTPIILPIATPFSSLDFDGGVNEAGPLTLQLSSALDADFVWAVWNHGRLG